MNLLINYQFYQKIHIKSSLGETIGAGYKMTVTGDNNINVSGSIKHTSGGSNETKAGGGITIPKMAEGGIVTGPTLAMIGEAGPEAVIPLKGKNAGMGANVTINISGGISSAADIGRSVVDALTQYTQVYGPLDLAIR